MARAELSKVVFLDTHIVCWLYSGETGLLSEQAIHAIEQARLFISPIVDLELQLLYEINRITKPPQVILAALWRDIALETKVGAFDQIVITARKLFWTRDPFDRLIVAQAMAERALLVTKDTTIRKHSEIAVW